MKRKTELPEEHEWENEDEKSILELSDRLMAQKKINVDRNWNELNKRIRNDHLKIRLWKFIRTSAAILLLPVLILSTFLYIQLEEWKSAPVEQVELVAAYGVVSKVALSDGSEVWLNSGSKLIYPNRFVGKRQVYLSGEAYFKVKSDATNRFDVQTTDGITVSAYGTEFNVQAYEEEADVTATLAKGQICIEQEQLKISRHLKPGEQAIFAKKEKNISLHEANILMETAWKDGKIVFRRTPMEDVAKQLSRHFNVDIQLQGKEVFDYSYSATFTTETLAEILSLLEKSAPIRCEIIEPEQQGDYAFSKKKVLIHILKTAEK